MRAQGFWDYVGKVLGLPLVLISGSALSLLGNIPTILSIMNWALGTKLSAPHVPTVPIPWLVTVFAAFLFGVALSKAFGFDQDKAREIDQLTQRKFQLTSRIDRTPNTRRGIVLVENNAGAVTLERVRLYLESVIPEPSLEELLQFPTLLAEFQLHPAEPYGHELVDVYLYDKDLGLILPERGYNLPTTGAHLVIKVVGENAQPRTETYFARRTDNELEFRLVTQGSTAS